ncbi:alternative ribosome rescue aminoacyl-tRNA hydrolase ArfB [Lichenicoccus sp.]|uniref:alternative ribosome rescue aminoacyl-tRNA hydrolase ArfB n=1 Tax=Lichenicoccus sp. TaxID=2781899 RepID=UPI003D0DD7C5
MHLDIAPGLSIDANALEISFITAGGPGGQNVNKLATAAQLRFDLRASGLPPPLLTRLAVLAGSRLTREDVIVITAREFRSQERNRQAAIARLAELIAEAAKVPIRRRPTKASRGERLRRLEAKSHRAATKRSRALPEQD